MGNTTLSVRKETLDRFNNEKEELSEGVGRGGSGLSADDFLTLLLDVYAAADTDIDVLVKPGGDVAQPMLKSIAAGDAPDAELRDHDTDPAAIREALGIDEADTLPEAVAAELDATGGPAKSDVKEWVREAVGDALPEGRR